MADVVKEFLVESYENLDRLDRDFVDLEQNPSNESLANIFRAIHSIKGTCGFLGFSKLESLTHAGEGLLSLLRDGQLQVNRRIIDALLAMIDAVRELLSRIETDGAEGDLDYTSLIELLGALQKNGGIPVDRQGASPPARAELSSAMQNQSELRTAVLDSTVRVDVRLLDKLMNLAGELVLARNQITQVATNQEGSVPWPALHRLNLVTAELQEKIRKSHMQPIGNVWNKFPRLARSLAAACGKQVRVAMAGEETELDRTIVEAIKDPLTHVLRNSVDHGIETPAARIAAGKVAEGRIMLRAFHEGGQVVIEIRDDGAGINPGDIRHKALQLGVISTDQARRMAERELINLIFLPGFSTAQKVTNLSGRGVGLDVVRTNIEKISGRVDVKSKWREGTTIKFKIPLTLAVIPALMVRAGSDTYAIPQLSVLELVRLAGEQAKKAINNVHKAPVFRWRGNLLPLVQLSKLLKASEQPHENGACINIVVLQANGREFGLVVDRIGDCIDIVAKPLGKQLKKHLAFSGATILGDGGVALILDVSGIAPSSSKEDVLISCM
jgi:two-component system chemotaxis sensor kinase CheA